MGDNEHEEGGLHKKMESAKVGNRGSNLSWLCKLLSKVDQKLFEDMQANNGNAERRQAKVQLGTGAGHSI